MSDKIKFDCGNKTEDCDNVTICPCLLFMDKIMKSYEQVLNSDVFREATKEEQNSVSKYIKEHSVDAGINFYDSFEDGDNK